jgi:hypothetical protein
LFYINRFSILTQATVPVAVFLQGNSTTGTADIQHGFEDARDTVWTLALYQAHQRFHPSRAIS